MTILILKENVGLWYMFMCSVHVHVQVCKCAPSTWCSKGCKLLRKNQWEFCQLRLTQECKLGNELNTKANSLWRFKVISKSLKLFIANDINLYFFFFLPIYPFKFLASLNKLFYLSTCLSVYTNIICQI